MSTKANPFDHPEIKTAMDLCLSCKGCTAECPSNVDMSTLKAEFLYHYQKANGVPLRSKAFANIANINKLGSLVPGLTNFALTNSFTSGLLKKSTRCGTAALPPHLAPPNPAAMVQKRKSTT
jgi:Fe-S oxidoreductase